MKSISTLCFVFFLVNSFILLAFGKESNATDTVLVLDEDNFNSTLSSSDGLLVMFYAPWCKYSQAVAPEYEKAAVLLKKSKSKVKLAKVDATKNSDLLGRFYISGYPTLKFFKDGRIAEYSGGRDAEGIVRWLEYKLLNPVKKIESETELDQFVDSADTVAIGFFNDIESESAVKFNSTAFSRLDTLPCAVVTNAQLRSKFEVEKDTIILIKKQDNDRIKFTGPFEVDDIAKFIKNNKLPLLNEYSIQKAPELFDGDVKKHLLLFVDKSNQESFQSTMSAIRPAAKTFLGKVIFIYIDCSENENGKLLHFFGLSSKECPTVRSVAIDRDMAKYKPDFKEITTDGVEKFVDEVLRGAREIYRMMQELPDDWNKGAVKILVAKNFKEVALDKSKNVFVKFYASWCPHSKMLAPTWQKLGEALASNDSIVIAKIDSPSNELEDYQIDSFPTLKLFPAGSDEPIDYTGAHTLEMMKYFIESGGKLPNKFSIPAPPGFPKGARIEVELSPVMIQNGTDDKAVTVNTKKEDEKKSEDKKDEEKKDEETKNEEKKDEEKKDEEKKESEQVRKPVERKEEL